MEARDLAVRAAALTGTDVDAVTVDAVPYAWGSPATAGLWTVTLPPGVTTREYFVKLLRHPRLWPGLVNVPEAFREYFLTEFPWQFEWEMHRCGISAVLPPGMRTPTLHLLERLDDDHLALWWERIHERSGRWSLDEYAWAAYRLGRLAARRRDGALINRALPPICHREPNWALRYLVEGRVLGGAVPELSGTALWEHPRVDAAVSRLGEHRLRHDLLSLAGRIPTLLDLLETLPMTYAHGDASPQNLLIDERDPDTFVVIDWGLGSLLPVGFDLGQLLVGPVHAGLVDPDEIETVDAAILDPYVAGLARDGLPLPAEIVRTGYHVSVALRSSLTTLSVQELATQPSELLPVFVDQRIRLARRLLDLTDDAVASALGRTSSTTPATR